MNRLRAALGIVGRLFVHALAGAFDGRRVCARCVREVDDVQPSTFGDFSLCARCQRSVTSGDLAFVLLRNDAACPVCRTAHVDSCRQEDVERVLGTEAAQ